MDTTAPRCSIIIPLFNQATYTERCLVDLMQHTPEGLYEVVLVDNGSTDATSYLLECLEDVTIIRNPRNLGYARACNQGARAATGEHLLFLNNDTEPRPGWLEPLLAVLDDQPDVGAVGSKLLFPDGTIQHAGVTVAEDRRTELPFVCWHEYHRFPADDPRANVRADWQVVTAASILIRRGAFEAVGGFCEDYWNGYEDIDLCFKLAEEGWRIVYEPRSCLIHHESVSGPERFARVNENVALLCERWAGRVVPDVLVTESGAVVVHPDRGTDRRSTSPAA